MNSKFSVVRLFSLLLLACVLTGCAPIFEHLSFPEAPFKRTSEGIFYDVHHTGKPDFALLYDKNGKLDILAYDDDGDGQWDRLYRLSDYRNEDVPHVILLLDSIPFQEVDKRYRGGDFAFFDPPQKVIPPFPSLTEQIFSQILDSPPLPGMVADYYDTRSGTPQMGIAIRILGYEAPWADHCNYRDSFFESLQSYLRPNAWYVAELSRAKEAIDDSPRKISIVYFASTSGLLSKYGEAGCKTCLDGAQRLCMQLLYERQGAVKISMLADHGHNLTPSKNIPLEPFLNPAGFRSTSTVTGQQDVVIEMDGLLNYIGMHTRQPVAVSDALIKHHEIELATYLDKDRVIVRNADGDAAIEMKDGRLRYTILGADSLGYKDVIEKLRAAGKVDAGGYVSEADWFTATLDHEFPDAPKRLWDAFHGMTYNPPDVMITIRDGWCCGPPALDFAIDMASTHGSLNQINSATFLMSMTGRVKQPLRSKEIFPTILPGVTLPLLR